MIQNQKYCAGCGAPATPGASHCGTCGRPFLPQGGPGVPVPPRAPAPGQVPPSAPAPGRQGYAAPPVNTAQSTPPPSGYGGVTPPGAAPGYGAQPPAGGPAPVAGGWQQPAPPPSPGYPPPAQYPGGPAAVPVYGAKPAKKKNRVALIVIVSVLVAVVAGVVVWLAVWVGSGRMEYQQLRDSICAAQSPAQVVQNAALLETFEQQYPGLVEPDLRTLVDKCAEYQNAEERDSKYINMVNYLTSLEGSQVPAVAGCADVLMETVQEQDSQYLAEAKAADEQTTQQAQVYIEEEQPQVSAVSGGLLQPVYTDFTIDTGDDGEQIFSFSCVNQSDLTIDYYEVWVYCYDADGYAIPGADGTGVEWMIDSTPDLAPGETLDKDEGYWTFYNCKDVSIIVPVISYIEFEDGTTWGVTNEEKVFDSDMELLLLLMSLDVDVIAEALADQGLAQSAVLAPAS